VFDEATSALDNATEREVMAAIEALGGQFTSDFNCPPVEHGGAARSGD
jgi:hypothetical protein